MSAYNISFPGEIKKNKKTFDILLSDAMISTITFCTFLLGDASCNRRLEQYIGWFTSPNYPQSYPNNKHCSWEIHVTGVDPQSHIQLRFITFSLQRDKMSDYVEVYDGPNETYELIGRYDGNSFPPDIIESTQSWMLVKFISDSFASFSGFNATYQVKGKELT